MKPGENLEVVKQFRSLLVIQTHQAANAGRNIATKFEVIVADTKLILFTPRDDSFAAKTETVKLLERACPWIRYPSAKKDPKSSSRIMLVLIKILIKIIVNRLVV